MVAKEHKIGREERRNGRGGTGGLGEEIVVKNGGHERATGSEEQIKVA